MGVALRILQLIVIAILMLAVTGVDSMASEALDDPCCEESGDPPGARDDDREQRDCGAGDCSPFCFSCPSRTVAITRDAILPTRAVTMVVVAAPDVERTVPPDPPQRDVFHPPRPSPSASSR